MVQNQPKSSSLRYFSTVTAKKVDWLWYPYIPFGKVTIVQGDPGDGKTTLALNIAALLSNGRPMPDMDVKVDYSTIIYQSAEDGAEDTIKPRLVSAGADCSRIAFIDETERGLTLNDERIEKAIKDTDARLLVIDPLQAYLSEGGEMNRADGVRPLMKHLTAVADRTGCAIVIIGHMNKASGAKGIYRGLGSIDITASARSVLLVGRIKSNPSVRIMAQLKNSLAEEGSPIAFEINENSTVRWIGEYDITAEELLSGDEPQYDSPKLTEAIENLESILSEGETPCAQIYSALKERGIGKRSIDRAKKHLGIKSSKRGDGWYWSMPAAMTRIGDAISSDKSPRIPEDKPLRPATYCRVATDSPEQTSCLMMQSGSGAESDYQPQDEGKTHCEISTNRGQA